MNKLGFALVGLVLTVTPALAQTAPPGPPQQQASLPAAPAFDDMLTAIRNSGTASDQISALPPLPDSKVEIRDAFAIEQNGGNRDLLQQAFNDNKPEVQKLRQSVTQQKSVNLALARQQVPITNVLAANVEPDGRVIVYAYPQTHVPPQ